jgi:hypothetical protein
MKRRLTATRARHAKPTDAGAQQEVIASIQQLGVRNVILEAREAPDGETLKKVRKLSATGRCGHRALTRSTRS